MSNDHLSSHPADEGDGSDLEFRPSAEFSVPADGPR